MNDNENDIQNSDPSLQALVDYYRNKSSKIEYEFLLYQIKADAIIKSLQQQLSEATATKSK